MEASNHSEVQKPGIIEVHRADVQNSPLQRQGSRTSSGSAGVMESDNEEQKHGQRPPPLDISAAQGVSSSEGPKTPASPRLSRPGGSGRTGPDRGRKIGHRRVGQGGEVTYKKIQTSQIMGSIQLGIGHAVGGLASKPERDLLMQDFMTVETTYFPSDGSSITPAHHYSDFRFKNYAPIAFRYFRDLFGIQPDDFLLSLCNEPLIELSNPGASGSIFYLSSDDEFIIKTVQHKEGEFLQKLLPGYYMNLTFNPRTLLPKFFGLYCYQCNSKNVRIVVMNNLLPTTIKMHEKYDLKGSTYKRKASKFERSKNSPVFKDLDFMEFHSEGIMLEADTYSALMKTIQRDCRVLESFKIMDYSLLVGIHNLDLAAKEDAERRKSLISNAEEEERREFEKDNEEPEPASLGAGGGPPLTRSRSLNRQRLVAHSTALESIQAESEPIDEEEDVPPGGIPARNSKGERLLLFIGIIDILQSYRLKKKLEHTFKAMIHDGDTVSVHRPGFYSQRFQDFMAKRVFKKVPSLDLPEFKGKHRKFRTLVTSYIALKHSPSKKKVGVRTRASTNLEAGQGSDGAETSQDSGAGSPPHTPTPVSPPSSMSQPPPVQHHPINLPAVLKDRVPSQKIPMSGATGLGTGPRVPPPVPPRSPRRVVIQTPRGIPASDRDSLPSSSNTPPPGFDEAVGLRGIRPPSPSPLPLAVKPRPVHATDSPYHRTQVLVAREDRSLHSPRSITPTLRTSHAGSSSWSSHVEAIRSNFERTSSTNSSTSSQPNSQISSVDHNLLSTQWVAKTTTIARSSISEIRLETRTDSKSSNLSGESGVRTGPTATPTWTEGTPSFTESSSSGDLAGVGSPARSVSPLQEITETITYHEGEMVSVITLT